MAPKARTHLAADALFALLRHHCSTIPDHRSHEAGMSLPDALMAGCALFSRTCPSRLDFAKQRAAGNLQTLYGLAHVPGDSARRERPDPRSPASLRPLFTAVFRQLPRGKALEEMVFVKGGSLWALD